MYNIADHCGEVEQRLDDPLFFDGHYRLDDGEWLRLFIVDSNNRKHKEKRDGSTTQKI
ncbi:MAG: hypothetical protein GY938_13155 [Ketobacter sp.]|nr:hypothetical protein [Ketobacter sp.]